MIRSGATRDPADWLLHGHHPDWRRTPPPSPGRVQPDRLRAALGWNVFRTLALVNPSWWLRALHARMFGFDTRYRAPEWLDVRLWASAESDDAAGSHDTVDVLLESQHAVWGFLTVYERDVLVTARDVDGPDPLRRTMTVTQRLARGRRCFVGLISSGEPSARIGARLARRYGMGAGTWDTCAIVMADAARSRAVGEPERLALTRCLRWLAATL